MVKKDRNLYFQPKPYQYHLYINGIEKVKVCQNQCTTTECINSCIEDLSSCNDACPCNAQCPSGCTDCDNKLCKCDPETNEDSRVCYKQLEQELLECLDLCTINDKEMSKLFRTKHYFHIKFYISFTFSVHFA